MRNCFGVLVWCISFYVCSMWEGRMTDVLDFEADDVVWWAADAFGHVVLGDPAPLAGLVMEYLDSIEAAVRVGAHKMLMDDDPEITLVCHKWLSDHATSRECYATSLLQVDMPTDGLFLTLAMAWATSHAGVLHADGFWTMCEDSLRVHSDLLVALMNHGFHHVICGSPSSKVELFAPLEEGMGWNMLLVMIRVKIANIDEALWNTRYEPKLDSQPEVLINVLSELFGMQP